MTENFSKYVEAKDSAPIVVLMQGFPGSGKSYRAKQILQELGGGDPHGHIFSTDDFWIPTTKELRAAGEHVSDEDEYQEYKSNWTQDRLGEAHGWNLDRFKQAVDNRVSPLIVDNTNTTIREMKPYAEYADKAGYRLLIREPTSDWWKDLYQPFSRDRKANADKLDPFVQELMNRNTHGVPEFVIRKMIDRYKTVNSPEEVLGRKPKI